MGLSPKWVILKKKGEEARLLRGHTPFRHNGSDLLPVRSPRKYSVMSLLIRLALNCDAGLCAVRAIVASLTTVEVHD